MKSFVLVLVGVLVALVGCSTSTPAKPAAAAYKSTFDVACPAFAAHSAAVSSGDGLLDKSLPCLGKTGGSVSLNGAPGVPMVVNFWASSCDPCREEMGILSDFNQSAKGTVKVLGVDTRDPLEAADSFATDLKLGFPSVVDSNGDAFHARSLVGLPDSVLIDAQGKIVYTQIGAFSSGDDLRAKVKQYLNVSVA